MTGIVGIDSMKADQEKLLQERASKLRQKLKSNPANKDQIEGELEQVEEKLKGTVSLSY